MRASSIQLKTAIPGPRSLELQKRRDLAVSSSIAQLLPVFAARTQGALMEDVDGNLLLDFGGGIGCANGGHTDKAVVEAIQRQAEKFLHTCFMVSPYESYVRLAECLNRLAPGDSEKRTLLVNSGAEAVENAVKLARAYTGRPCILCFEGAYHGRTYMAMALTSKMRPYKEGFAPFPGAVFRAPYPQACGACAETGEERLSESLAALEKQILEVGAERFAAVILEPIQGEGGFVVPPRGFLQGVRELCDRYRIVFIVDEVQTGFGRTGKMFACEHEGVEPDLLVSAKSLGSGMPIAAVTGKVEIMNHPIAGALGGTYGGNPLACEAALATIDLFEREGLAERSEAIGQIFRARAERWQERFECIGEVRGIGGMQAIVLVTSRATGEPADKLTKDMARWAIAHGLLLVTAGTYGNVIRLLVPLVVSTDDLEAGLDIIEAGLEALAPEAVR